ncbi:MAG: hypothetical protein WKF82_08515 [Nocardioidaceae bacterium]
MSGGGQEALLGGEDTCRGVDGGAVDVVHVRAVGSPQPGRLDYRIGCSQPERGGECMGDDSVDCCVEVGKSDFGGAGLAFSFGAHVPDPPGRPMLLEDADHGGGANLSPNHQSPRGR